MSEGARVIEFDTFDNAAMYACQHGGRIWQGDDDGRVVWFNPRVSIFVTPTRAFCKGRGFVGSWRESIERRHRRLALH
ncbi:hypothetical protein BE04_26010 [Sorangium cellulosum]|uniref:Uncharacterized protein n=1 Tax=Sorangium cellulosum TaxID=56 RepID=A0A150PX55_SORCE|nr:hypothetical protein BE04_26010 [Sorangium cellulosum]